MAHENNGTLVPLFVHEFEWRHEYITPHSEEKSRVARYASRFPYIRHDY